MKKVPSVPLATVTPEIIHHWLLAEEQTLLKSCRYEATRGSGPGGQKKNKTSSAVRLVHLPTGLSSLAAESRSQQTNRTKAIQRLYFILALTPLSNAVAADFALPPEWSQYVSAGRVLIGRKNRRGQAYISHFFITAHRLAHGEIAIASELLALSPAKFRKIVKSIPPLQRKIAEERYTANLHQL